MWAGGRRRAGPSTGTSPASVGVGRSPSVWTESFTGPCSSEAALLLNCSIGLDLRFTPLLPLLLLAFFLQAACSSVNF